MELSTIFATTPSQWTSKIIDRKLDIFDHKMLLLPFNGNGQTSLFVVVCPGHIREYSNKSYRGSRPCILHLDPNQSTSSSHDHNAVGERLLGWLNCLWRHKYEDNNPLSTPFNKRSMPLCRPDGKCTEDTLLVFLCSVLISFVVSLSVHIPQSKTDAGVCVLRCALGLTSISDGALSGESLDRDGHNGVFRDADQFKFNDCSLSRLRDECIHLLVNVAEQYSLVLAEQIPSAEIEQTVSPGITDNEDSSHSSACHRTCCGNRRTFIPQPVEVEDDDCSILYNEVTDDDSDEDYVDDSASVDGLESEMAQSYVITSNSSKPHCIDKLICPGDVVEYKLIGSTKVISKATILTIEDKEDHQFILLDNELVLRPYTHSVRKVRMYCGANDHRLSNPLAEWHDLQKCILQSGSVLCDKETDHDINSGRSHGNVTIDGDDDGDDDADDDDLVLNNDKGQRLRTSEGLTENLQNSRMKKLRKENKVYGDTPDYHQFKWITFGTNEYYKAVDLINGCYLKMLQIGKTFDAFRKVKKNIVNMLKATTKKEFLSGKHAVYGRFDHHVKGGKAILNITLDVEIVPDPRKCNTRRKGKGLTNREIMTKEQILTFEHNMESLNVIKCSVCMECIILEMPPTTNSEFTCRPCKARRDPTFYLDNNLHPVWYLLDDDGNYLLGDDGKKVPQYHIPSELSRLTMAEKLLIRRCANFVPSIHLKNGVFALKGHCVTFPQDISAMCDELPQRKETMLTFIRNIGNKDTDAVYPISLRVNRTRIIAALVWLKRHNPFYRSIKINESNLDWMEGEDEVNIGKEAVQIDMVETQRSRMKEAEEEHVSKSNTNGLDSQDQDDELLIHAMHANDKQSIPTGRQAAPIKELIKVAKKSGQMGQVMKYPPIDHDTPIS